MITISPLNRRRLMNFRKNRRAVWSLWIFALLFGLSLFAEFLANDKPILVNYRGNLYSPVIKFYPETTFGGDFKTEATYRDPEVKCLIKTGGLEMCFDDPEKYIEAVDNDKLDAKTIGFKKGWMIWPPVPYSYDTPNDLGRSAPSPPDWDHLLGTDDTTRDVLARVTPLDMRSKSFKTGMTQRSMLMHMQASISCLGKSHFRVMVFRSMALTVVHDLAVAMESVAARAKKV